MFKLLSDVSHVTPFSDLLDEFGKLIIQNEHIYSLIDESGTRERGIRSHLLEKLGTVREFEKDYLSKSKETTPGNFVTRTATDAFFHRLIDTYLTNQICPKITCKSKDEFLQHNSPFRNKPTTLLTKDEVVEYAGTKTKHTDKKFLQIGDTKFYESKNTTTKKLSQTYNELSQAFRDSNKISIRYNPLYNAIHTKARYGSNVFSKK